MVSFQCDGCADTVKKPKLDQHRQRCWASFTCLDCSKTFQNQEYKSHTSCISEAEKYQGALYKGPRKGQQNQTQQAKPTPVAEVAVITPLDSAASSPAPPAIHPSRLQQVDSGSSAPPSYGYPARGGAARGGRGGPPARAATGSKRNPLVSGENKAIPQTGMRSWGSPVIAESEPTASNGHIEYPIASTSSAFPTQMNGEKKKKKRKGDKGGTGAKANSKRPREEPSANGNSTAPSAPAQEEEPVAKKRKRSASPVVETVSAEISDKTLKRLRKNASKVAEKSPSLSLSDWLKQVGDAKKEQVDAGDVNRAAKVSWEGGKWILSF